MTLRERRDEFLKDDDDDDDDDDFNFNDNGNGKSKLRSGARSKSKSSEMQRELEESGVDPALMKSARQRGKQRASRNARIAQRKLDSDFKMLLPLCDLIHLRYRSSNKTNEKLDLLVEAVRLNDRSGGGGGGAKPEVAKARVELVAQLLPHWCDIVEIPTFAGKKKVGRSVGRCVCVCLCLPWCWCWCWGLLVLAFGFGFGFGRCCLRRLFDMGSSSEHLRI